MGCQLTIRKKASSPQEVFTRARTYTLEQEDISLGGEGSTCLLHDYEGEPARIQGVRHHYTFVPPEKGAAFLINDQPVSSPQVLHSGDAISIGDDRIRFYLQYEKAQIARSSQILSQLTHIGVAVILVIQFLFMFFLVSWLRGSSLWERQQTRLSIVHRMDNLRRLYGSPKNFHTPLKKAIGQEIFLDLTEQAHFVRRYSEHLLPHQRRALLHDLSRYESIYQWLSDPAPYTEEQEIDINQAVLNILNTHTPK